MVFALIAGENMQTIWFHGTNQKNAASILKTGFHEGTWFSRHMEAARKFGGPIVFAVKVRFAKTPMRWQVCTNNTIPSSSICNVYAINELDCSNWTEQQFLAVK